MKYLHRLFAFAAAAFFIAGSALGQNAGTVTNHAFPIGKGAGVAGYTSLLCGAGTIPIGQVGADPICQSISGDITIGAGGVAAIGSTVVHSAMLNADVFSTARSWGGPQTFVNPIVGTQTPGDNSTKAASTAYADAIAALKANIASPTFTGIPAAPTAAVDTNTTQLATTAYVIGQAASATPLIDGAAAVGTSTRFARGDHVHPTDTTRAPLASPTFTGVPAAPTAAAGTNTTQIATTANVVSQTAAFTGHGDSIYTILATDRTVGTNAAFTASRTWTLPAANAVNAGQEIIVADFQGTVTGVNTLVVSRAGADTINGGTTASISAANGGLLLRSDGVSKWTSQAFTAGTGVTGITCFGVTITTSGTCVTAATKSDEQTGSSATAVVTPSQQQSHDSAIKVFVIFDGTAGCSPCTNSYNVGSVTRTGAGRYTINFTTAFSASTSYGCTFTQNNGSTFASGVLGEFQTPGTTSVLLATDTAALAASDPAFAVVICMGRQ